MIARMKPLSGSSPALPPLASLPEGRRVYAIGDIHGRLDLLAALAETIEHDDAARGLAKTSVVLLGDLIDRGPDSAGVIRFARDWQQRREVRILGGNHEEMFLKSFHSTDTLRHFLRHGGRETLFSYGIDPKAYTAAPLDAVQRLMAEAVSEEERAFVAGFEDMVTLGDYVFVHAGINPALPLDGQSSSDLRWIREPFLSHAERFERVVVHGHTIAPEVVSRENRIGVDTGAYASGRLTAVALEGSERRFIEAVIGESGAISTRLF